VEQGFFRKDALKCHTLRSHLDGLTPPSGPLKQLVKGIFQPQDQADKIVLGSARNGDSQADAKPSYRVISVEPELTKDQSVADFKDPFYIEWQLWSLRGVLQ
jgi:hypothetical protein